MKIFHSLRWRIQLWHGSFLLVVLVGLGIAAYRSEKAAGIKRIDDDLAKRLALLLDSLPRREGGRPPPGQGPPGEGPPGRPRRDPPPFRLPAERDGFFGEKSGGFYYAVWRREGELLSSSSNIPKEVLPPPKPSRSGLVSTNRERGHFREAYTHTPPGEAIIVGCSTEPTMEALRQFGLRLVAIEGIILLVGLGGGWWVTSRALRPLAVIAETSHAISDGHLDQRIKLNAPGSELGQLADQLNGTFAKLESAFARQAQFTSDAAHELRTPLSVVISQAQMALRGDREPAEYREMFEASLRGAKRMQKLTQSLLELARLDQHAASAERIACDLAALASDAAEIVELPASERGITLIRNLAPAPCTVDPDSITRVILNLLANAIEHGREDSQITLTTSSSGGSAILSVADQGPGIAEKHLPHLFDRFYRADESRNRKTGGTGLGLAICKAIVDSHCGHLTVASTIGNGTVFTVSLPEK